jgi:putative transposase
MQVPEEHLAPDLVHMLISFPPKYSVAEVIGHLKAKNSILDGAELERKPRNFLADKFWARGLFVGAVRRNEEMIRAYIRDRAMANKELLDQPQLKLASS